MKTNKIASALMIVLVQILVACNQENAPAEEPTEKEETEDRLIAPISRGQPDTSEPSIPDIDAPNEPDIKEATACEGVSFPVAAQGPCLQIAVAPMTASSIDMDAALMTAATTAISDSLAAALPNASISASSADWRLSTSLIQQGSTLQLSMTVRTLAGVEIAKATREVVDSAQLNQDATILAGQIADQVVLKKACLKAAVTSKVLDFSVYSKTEYVFGVNLTDLRGAPITGDVSVDVARAAVGQASVEKLANGRFNVSYLMHKDDHNVVELSSVITGDREIGAVKVPLYARCGLVMEIVGEKKWHHVQYMGVEIEVDATSTLKALIPMNTDTTDDFAHLGTGVFSEELDIGAYQSTFADCTIDMRPIKTLAAGTILATSLDRHGDTRDVWIRGGKTIPDAFEMHCPDAGFQISEMGGLSTDIVFTESMTIEDGFSVLTTGDDGISHYSYQVSIKRLAQ